MIRSELSLAIQKAGLILLSQDKSKDIFDIPDYMDDYLLILFADNFIAEMTSNFFLKVLNNFRHYFVFCNEKIDYFLPDKLQNNKLLQSNAIIVKKLEPLPIEYIITGLDNPIFAVKDLAGNFLDFLDIEEYDNWIKDVSINIYKTVAKFTENNGILTLCMRLKFSPEGILVSGINSDTCDFVVKKYKSISDQLFDLL